MRCPGVMGGGLRVGLMLAGLVMVAGCRGPGSAGTGASGAMAVGAGWSQQSGQAVWRSKEGAEEIPGDLAWGRGPGATYVLEFSKPALPLVRVSRAGDGRWSVSAAGRGQRSGRGRSPSFSWFVLGGYLAGESVAPPWTAGRGAEAGSWWVEHPGTGERIEGFLEGTR